MIGRGWKVWVIALLLLAPALAMAGEARVLEAVLATGVENRQPVGAASAFAADVGRVYAFTRIAGAESEGSVTHVWYYAGQVKAQVQLPVRSEDWRTWSSKTVLPNWTGEWLVEVQAPDGRVLASLPFTVE